MGKMLTWGEFREVQPELAEAGRKLFYFLPRPVGLGILATTRKDGGPRVHPCCPMIFGGHLFAFVIPSPKRQDLHRDGRYALHCYPPAENEDAFSLAGRAELVADDVIVAAATAQYLAERQWERPIDGFDEQELFEFMIDRCLLTRTTGHGDPHPRHKVWRS
ncbi:MAG: pyridoxamine 5'-phosphate oxidase [Chloroflexi bacterium]|nr:pyridoxamine 5'-phosphate oxidase [Chloroflexota bacterium]